MLEGNSFLWTTFAVQHSPLLLQLLSIHLLKNCTLSTDGLERARYGKFDNSLLKGAFIKLFQSKEDEGC
jgi:hypothetical protein